MNQFLRNNLLLFLTFLLFQNYCYSQLSGSYTIGPGGDYLNINNAVTALNTSGISGPVVFNIKSGGYNNSVELISIFGSSETNTVTFQSLAGNRDSVKWKSYQNTFVIFLNGASNIIIKNLSLESNHYTAVYTVNISGGRNISFVNCVFKIFDLPDINLKSTGTENLKLEDNYFISHWTSIEINNSSGNLIFTNNIVSSTGGIIISNHQQGAITFDRNIVGTYTTWLSPISLRILNSNCGLFITRNKIKSEIDFRSGTTALMIVNCNFDSTLIANNFIKGAHALSVSNSINLNIYFNTLVGNSAYTPYEFNLIIENSSNCKVLNNMMVPRGLSFTAYANNSNSNIVSDYNIFHTPTPFGSVSYVAFYNSIGYTTLNQFQAASNNDFNSIVKDPEFEADYYHLTGNSIGDITLAGIPIPGITHDIDGDLRDTEYPYIGADEANIILPVNIASFTYSVNRSEVKLYWSTNTELNNDRFEIERRNVLNPEFDKIGVISGHGTTNSLTQYSFTDSHVPTGKYFYRLRQIDYNGSYEYLNLNEEIYVGITEQYTLSQNYPNPFNPTTKFDFNLPADGNVSIKIFDISGREVISLINNKFHTAGYYTVELNGNDLASGIYFYEMKAGDFTAIKKLVLLK